nr:hypothetical protein [Lachnospiraceae bacterium]
NGFTGVTDGFGREPYMRQGLVFYPIAFNTDRDVRSKAPGFTTVVLHPGTMSEKGFDRLSRMVSDPEVHTAPYSRFLEETPVKQGIPGLISGYLKADFKRRYVRLRGNGGDPGKHIGETYVYD